jgi:hypothetical protein
MPQKQTQESCEPRFKRDPQDHSFPRDGRIESALLHTHSPGQDLSRRTCHREPSVGLSYGTVSVDPTKNDFTLPVGK